jgi:hypothetical protein
MTRGMQTRSTCLCATTVPGYSSGLVGMLLKVCHSNRGRGTDKGSRGNLMRLDSRRTNATAVWLDTALLPHTQPDGNSLRLNHQSVISISDAVLGCSATVPDLARRRKHSVATKMAPLPELEQWPLASISWRPRPARSQWTSMDLLCLILGSSPKPIVHPFYMFQPRSVLPRTHRIPETWPLQRPQRPQRPTTNGSPMPTSPT